MGKPQLAKGPAATLGRAMAGMLDRRARRVAARKPPKRTTCRDCSKAFGWRDLAYGADARGLCKSCKERADRKALRMTRYVAIFPNHLNRATRRMFEQATARKVRHDQTRVRLAA